MSNLSDFLTTDYEMKLHELLPHGFVFKMRVFSEEYRIE